MMIELISHINGDNDLIEAWLRYYIRLGVGHFRLVVHGTPAQNERLLSIKRSYPITIEDMYGGAFKCEEKKARLDSILARSAGQWVVLVDSDEFVEFPYSGIDETIRSLADANANLMAAPMLQRLTADGSLASPPVIDDPFEIFPLCSPDLYRRMGMKGDIFKFPLFFCDGATRLREEGNHHPPLGSDPRASGMLGVTHHFKFRQTVSQRLDNMIRSEHPWRHESVQLRDYLDSHSNRLPLEGAFAYSREELFRRRLLRQAQHSSAGLEGRSHASIGISTTTCVTAKEKTEHEVHSATSSALRNIAFVLPKTEEFGGLERHLFMLLRGLEGTVQHPTLLCFDYPTISGYMDQTLLSHSVIRCEPEPKSFREWVRVMRSLRADIVVFCYNWFKAFPWQGPAASLVAGVPRRISIQHLLALPPPPPIEGRSPKARLRRLIGRRARNMLKTRMTGYICDKTICVSDAVRTSLVRGYQFPGKKTVTIHNGVHTSYFVPSETARAVVRAQFGVSESEFLLVCAARLTEAKGVDLLVRAVGRVVHQGFPCKCIIVGDGPLRESLEREANSLGLCGYVFFEGFRDDVRPYLQAASAFILTSLIEGLPLSVLEAMACGLPCIVTDVGGNAEAVKDRVTGLVIPAGSLDDAENAIIFLITHPSEYAEMARRAHETALANFDIDQKMNELKAVILGSSDAL